MTPEATLAKTQLDHVLAEVIMQQNGHTLQEAIDAHKRLIRDESQRAVEAFAEGLKKKPTSGQVPRKAIGTAKAGYYRNGFNEADKLWIANINAALDEPTE